MFKYFNCFFSSFFRTLGRIIVYILLGLVFSTILSKIDVRADSSKYVKLNGSSLNYKDYISIASGNRTFEFNEGTLYTSADQIPQNFLITFCSDTPKISSWYSNVTDNEFPHELNIYKTDIPCQFSTTDYNGGRIVYFYGTSFTFSVTGTNGSAWGKWTFYEPNPASYQLLNFITTNDDISIDFSSGAVISQNQQIINQNQQIINQGQQTNDKLDDINSSINDTSSPDLDALKNTAGWLPAGPIDSILNLPLTLLNSLTTNLSKSCSPVELPLPYIDKTITLPCLSTIYPQIDGLNVWINSISVIASAFILFQYLMNLYKWVDDTLSFRENNFIDNWTGV